jgi:hypothetical protein
MSRFLLVSGSAPRAVKISQPRDEVERQHILLLGAAHTPRHSDHCKHDANEWSVTSANRLAPVLLGQERDAGQRTRTTLSDTPRDEQIPTNRPLQGGGRRFEPCSAHLSNRQVRVTLGLLGSGRGGDHAAVASAWSTNHVGVSRRPRAAPKAT